MLMNLLPVNDGRIHGLARVIHDHNAASFSPHVLQGGVKNTL
jgi:hypothetical protein